MYSSIENVTALHFKIYVIHECIFSYAISGHIVKMLPGTPAPHHTQVNHAKLKYLMN